MPQHGEIDLTSKKVFCSHWMTQEEWDDIHGYSSNLNENPDEDEDTAKK